MEISESNNLNQQIELSDHERIKSILIDVKSKHVKNQKAPFDIESSASELLSNFFEETVHSILSESSCLAKHRKSDIIEPEDVQLILLKKYGLDIPGTLKKNILHKQSSLSNINSSQSKSILTSKAEIINSNIIDLSSILSDNNKKRNRESDPDETTAADTEEHSIHDDQMSKKIKL